MEPRRLLPSALLVVLSAAAGFLVAGVVHAPDGDGDGGGGVVRQQAARIEVLTEEVRRLRAEVDPVLAGRSDVAPAPEAHAPPRYDAPATPGALVDEAHGAPVEPEAHAPPIPTEPGGVLDVIRALGDRDARATDTLLVGDGDRMATLFAPRAAGPTVRAAETRPDAAIEDGTTIQLEAGTYDFSGFSGAHRGDFPADVTFRGIGMDRTRLILHEVSATGETRNLGFEDLTLDTRGHYLADVRGDEPISLRFERARVLGWDQTPGGAVLLAARHGAVLARDSRFEAGFGNAPGRGAFFHVRGPFLVRFERCTFVGPFARLYEPSEKGSYAWVHCVFEQLAEACRHAVESPDANLLFEDCSFAYLPEDETPAVRSRSEIDPSWR